MSTPKLDRLAINFIKRIPDSFETAFVAGSGVMPDANVLDAEQIISYLNQAMLKLFNMKWNEAFAMAKGKNAKAMRYFMGLLPEAVKYSNEMTADVAFNGTVYVLATPHLDFFKVIAAIGKDDQFIRVWDESKYLLAITGEYDEYVATEANPAIIQTRTFLSVFPTSLTSFTFRIQYLALPLDPTTGAYFTQNGSYDNPFNEQWNDTIVELAYKIYLIESQQTE
jgi:hypothetical protein